MLPKCVAGHLKARDFLFSVRLIILIDALTIYNERLVGQFHTLFRREECFVQNCLGSFGNEGVLFVLSRMDGTILSL